MNLAVDEKCLGIHACGATRAPSPLFLGTAQCLTMRGATLASGLVGASIGWCTLGVQASLVLLKLDTQHHG